MRCLRLTLGLAAALLVVTAAPVRAQIAALTPSEALACLTPPSDKRGAPDYPEDAYRRKDGGKVSVELVFTAPDEPPNITLTRGQTFAALEDAVRDHVRRYRVPCVAAGQSATLRQEFVFVPTDGRRVRWSAPEDAEDERRTRMLECLSHLIPGSKPVYPAMLGERGVQGTVVIRSKFFAPGAAPDVTVLDDAGSNALSASAVEWAKGQRMPCLDGKALDVTTFFMFRMDGGARAVLKDQPLVQFLASVKGIREASLYFDTREMTCPFELRFQLNQPYLPNSVGEVGQPDPTRRFLLDWLRRVHLDIPRRYANAVLGDSMTIHVPCVTVNLGALSGGGASQ